MSPAPPCSSLPSAVLGRHRADRSHPCDKPLSPLSKLQASNGGIFSHLDFSTVSPDYASKKGIFDPINVVERAKKVRRLLRDRPEGKIVGESPEGSVSES